MSRIKLLISLLIMQTLIVNAQDSAVTKIRPKYNNVSGLHRVFFGENYRKEWSTDIKLPFIRISQVAGGLKPLRLGGGHQTKSLRLAAPDGDEWVLRTIIKDASILLPQGLRQTFARDVVDDAMSAQHPFSPLVVAELARATNVPHAEPLIGIVDEDPMLGEFSKQFAGTVCLLEKREPFGNSDNSAKMMAELDDDNENSVDGKAFLRAQLLDLLIGDWDRHPDQWRWVDIEKGKTKTYIGVPRDRDQAFYVNQGVAPWVASLPWFVPSLQGFSPEIKKVKYSLKESIFLASRPGTHLSEQEVMQVTNDFVTSLPDHVIDEALKKLPQTAIDLRYNELADALKTRRDNLPSAMKEFYRFVNKTAEIKLSDKHEYIEIVDTANNNLKVQVRRLKRSGEIAEPIFNAVYDPQITKEFRLYTGKGQDSVVINNSSSPIRLRLIGGEGSKKYHVVNAARRVRVYDKKSNVYYTGQTRMLATRNSDDTSNTNFIPANRYNVWMPLIGFNINRDDGFQLGLGTQYTQQGFRKYPYASLNRLMMFYAFSTSAFKINYSGEWLHAIGKTDILANADIYAPENTQNFFGRGNETEFDKTGDYRRFYRTRFNIYQFTPALRWRNDRSGVMFSVGPSLQLYKFDSSDNTGRNIVTNPDIKSYDSVSLAESRSHAGVVMNFTVNKRNSPIIPTKGMYLNVRMQGFGGLNDNSEAFAQFIPEFSIYQKLNSKGTIVIADRIGAGITMGKSAFYQSLFIGGHDNLLGYRQYRFAGEHMVYNNFEVRMKIANFTGYIIPGQFGLIGFYDLGRVWVDDESSDVWHNGVGGGFFFAPAQIFVVSAVAGYSEEGLLPYVTMGFRF